MFYVEKQLALGPIRFGVNPRTKREADSDASLSTGARGEFVRHRTDSGYFFGGDAAPARAAAAPKPAALNRRIWRYFTELELKWQALIVAGLFFTLLGFLVLVRKGAAGWVEIILGAAMIATPIVLTAKERKAAREREERERLEREAIEKRNREMLASYTAALDRAQKERSDESFDALTREREALTLPYELWSAPAKRTVLLVAFDALASGGDPARIIDRVSSAAGLTADDTRNIKVDLYRTVVWHLLADDRLGEPQQARLAALREQLGINDVESDVVDAFRRIYAASLNPISCAQKLGFREQCVHESGPVHVTNKRVVVNGAKKPIDIPLDTVRDVTVAIDDKAVRIRAEKPQVVTVDDPLLTATVIDLAEELQPKPKGFA